MISGYIYVSKLGGERGWGGEGRGMNSFLLSVNNSFRSLILFSNPLYVVVEQWSKTNWGKKSWIVEFEFTCPGNTWWLSIVGNTPKHRLRLLDRNTGRRSTPTRAKPLSL